MSTWVDLGDLYVKKAGDTVSGSILMANNNLSVAYDSDTTYNVGTEIKSLRDSVSQNQYAVLYDDYSTSTTGAITVNANVYQYSFLLVICKTNDNMICFGAAHPKKNEYFTVTTTFASVTKATYLKSRTFKITKKTDTSCTINTSSTDGYYHVSEVGFYTDKTLSVTNQPSGGNLAIVKIIGFV